MRPPPTHGEEPRTGPSGHHPPDTSSAPPRPVASARSHCLNPLCSCVPQCLCTGGSLCPDVLLRQHAPHLPGGAGPSSLCRTHFGIAFLGNLPWLVPPRLVWSLCFSLCPAPCPSVSGAGMVWFASGSHSVAQSWASPVLLLTSFIHPTDVCLAPTPWWAWKIQQGSKGRDRALVELRVWWGVREEAPSAHLRSTLAGREHCPLQRQDY